MNLPSPASDQPVRLGALEAQVMDVLWDRGGATIRQIMDDLPSDPAYTTIATVLRNLERKELVGAQRQGRFVLHHPRVSRQELAATAIGHALAASGDRAASILHFVDTLSTQDRDLLRQYLQQHDSAADSRLLDEETTDAP